MNHTINVLLGDWEVLLARASGLAAAGDHGTAASIINDVFATHGLRCFGVALGKAIYAFVAAGGEAKAIKDVVLLFAGDRPRSREAQLWYSRFLRQTGAFDAAFAAHEMFMTGDTFEAHAHIERGLIFEQCGLRHGARDSFRLACSFAPNFAPAKQHLVRVERLLATSP